MLIDSVSKDGNVLLNVGPNARGEFEPKALDRLRGIGQWMRLHGRSIYGCGPSEFTRCSTTSTALLFLLANKTF